MPINFGGWIRQQEHPYEYTKVKTQAGKLVLFKWENALFYRVKTKAGHKCYSCDKDLPKGCYVYGDRYYRRLCINCFEDFMNNFMLSMDEHKQLAKESLILFQKEKGMMIKNNLINTIG